MHEHPESHEFRSNYSVECSDGQLRLEMIQFIEQFQILETVSKLTGLSWIQPITIRHKDIPTADFEGDSIVLVDFAKHHWALQGIAHEMVHLLIRQHAWNADARLKLFIQNHPELKNPYGHGYLLEQMAAYLIMIDVMKEVGRTIGNPRMISGWESERFENVLAREFKSPLKERIGRAIIAAWPSRNAAHQPLTTWLLDVAERAIAE